MNIYADEQGYYCGLLTVEDLELFLEARAQWYVDKETVDFSEQQKEFFKTQLLNKFASRWLDEFAMPRSAYFVIMQKTFDGKEDRIAGYLDIQLRGESAVLEYMQIITTARKKGLHLADMFYNAAKLFTLECTTARELRGAIGLENRHSINAARRNGLQRDDAASGRSYDVFTYDLMPLREKLESDPVTRAHLAFCQGRNAATEPSDPAPG